MQQQIPGRASDALAEPPSFDGTPGLHSLKRRLALALLALSLGVAAFVGYALNQTKLQKEVEVSENVQNFTRLLDQSITHSAQKIDLSLLGIADQLQEALRERHPLEGPQVNRLLEQHRNWLAQVADFRVTDASGLVRFGPGVDKDSKFSYADRPFFAQHRAAATQDMIVSNPVLGRVSKLWVVVLSRRYNHPDGRFAGVIAAAVPLSYFSKLLGELNLGPHGVALLRDSEGGMLARFPVSTDPSAQVGTKIYSEEFGQIMASGQTAVSYHTQKTGDGTERILSYRRLAGVPFHLVVGMGPGDYLADWRSQVEKAVIAACGLVLLSFLFAWGLWRSFSASEQSRRQSEHMLEERNQALQGLQTQTRLLREIVESLPYGLVVYDDQRAMRLQNSKFAQILRLPAAFSGSAAFSFGDFVRFAHQRGDYGSAEAADVLLERYTAAMDKRQVLIGERVQTDGSFIEFRAFPISSGWTVVTYLDNSVRHHEQSVLRDAQDRVRLATESAGLGIWELDLQSGELLWDAQQYRLYGMAPHSGSRDYAMWSQRVHPHDLAAAENAFKAAMATGDDYVCEFRVVWPDGSVRSLRALGRARLDANGQVVRMVGTNRDVTNALHAAQLLKDARDSAQEASTSKSQFLANMSHEIRTPMNAILGLLQLLGGTPLRTHQLEYVDKIEGAAKSLLGLLNDILDFSKIEAHKLDLEIEPFQTDRLMRELAVVLSAYVGTKEIEVLYDMDAALPPVLVGDALRLRQVLVNLGGNAIKFTAAGQVVVGLRVVGMRPGTPELVRLEFSVKDSGIGIAPENLPRLFSSFSQAEASTTRRFGGSGLGLAICKRLIALMGGEIALDSEVGVGTQFRFQLDFPVGQADPAAAEPPRPAATKQATRVLLVDDNPVACALLTRMMRGLGWTVDTAANGPAALAQLAASGPQARPAYDLVFVDSQLAGMDGWETVKRLRGLKGGAHPAATKYIMLSANGRDSLEKRTQEEQDQIHDFIVKPVTPCQLLWAAQRKRSAGAAVRRNPRSGKRELSGLRILVVEDNAINQQVAEGLLSGEGALVAIAANGRLGVNAIASARPQYDIVLMDVQMPVMDGYEATGVIRGSLGLADLPIIGLTANAMASDREKCLQAGMNDHLGKPYDLAQLVSMVIRLTGHQAALQAPDTVPPSQLPVVATERGAEIAGLDLDGALNRLGGMTGLYAGAAQDLLQVLPTWVPALVDAAQHGQAQEHKALLHTFKGTAATLGLMDLAAQLAKLESMAKAGLAWPECGDAVAALTRLVAQGELALQQALQQLGASAGAGSTAPVLPAVDLHSALQQLQTLLAQSDMRGLEVFATLRPSFEQLPAGDFERLGSALHGLEFDQALAICEELLRA